MANMVDDALRRYRPTVIVAGTLIGTALAAAVIKVVTTPWEELKGLVLGRFLKLAKLAGGGAMLAKEAEKIKVSKFTPPNSVRAVMAHWCSYGAVFAMIYAVY